MKDFFRNRVRPISTVVLSAASAVVLGAAIVAAATTISTNVQTDGTLAVTGLSSLSQASSTMLSANTAYFGATATSTFGSDGTLTVLGGTSLRGATSTSLAVTGSTTVSSVLNVGGAVNAGVGLTVGTLASTSQLIVGGDNTNGTISGMLTGFCNVTTAVSITATSTGYVDCAATGVRANDRVFVEATSSLPAGIIVEAASSSANGNINIQLNNANYGVSKSVNNISLNFWAVR